MWFLDNLSMWKLVISTLACRPTGCWLTFLCKFVFSLYLPTYLYSMSACSAYFKTTIRYSASKRLRKLFVKVLVCEDFGGSHPVWWCCKCKHWVITLSASIAVRVKHWSLCPSVCRVSCAYTDSLGTASMWPVHLWTTCMRLNTRVTVTTAGGNIVVV